jgi:hypothetical protein
MSNEIKKEITDEELKDHMINNAFNNTSLLDILQGLTQGVLTRFAIDLATKNINRSWENLTDADKEELKNNILKNLEAENGH